MSDPVFLRKRTSNLLSSHPSQNIGNMKVDRKTFHFLLDAWAFSGEPDAAGQAERLVQRMEELPQLQPDVRTYTKLINAIRRSSSQPGSQADDILQKMKYLADTSNPTARPNSYTYTAVVEAHSRDGNAQRCAELVQDMVAQYQAGDESLQPTARAFHAAISAFAREGQAVEAETLFDQMEQLYRSGVEAAKPTAVNYNSLISAWANGESARQAEQVLARMEEAYRNGNEAAKPTTVSFNAVIDAYTKSGEDGAAEKAEQVLRYMEELYETGTNLDAKPNVRSFNSVINAWAKSREENAAWKAQDMLDLMEKLYEQGNLEVRPDAHSFCTVINGTSIHPRGSRGEGLLSHHSCSVGQESGLLESRESQESV